MALGLKIAVLMGFNGDILSFRAWVELFCVPSEK